MPTVCGRSVALNLAYECKTYSVGCASLIDGTKRNTVPSSLRGDRGQQHDREPAQPARLDKVAVAGAHRIAIDPARFDFRAPAPLQRIIDADDPRPLWGEGLHQQEQQTPGHVPRRPAVPVQHAMIAG